MDLPSLRPSLRDICIKEVLPPVSAASTIRLDGQVERTFGTVCTAISKNNFLEFIWNFSENRFQNRVANSEKIQNRFTKSWKDTFFLRGDQKKCPETFVENIFAKNRKHFNPSFHEIVQVALSGVIYFSSLGLSASCMTSLVRTPFFTIFFPLTRKVLQQNRESSGRISKKEKAALSTSSRVFFRRAQHTWTVHDWLSGFPPLVWTAVTSRPDGGCENKN